MLRFHTNAEPELTFRPTPVLTEPPETTVLRAMLAGVTPAVAVHSDPFVRSRFLDVLARLLRQDGIRPIPIKSRDGVQIDLIELMDQVVGRACDDASERLELCHAALTTLEAAETGIALMIDDAQRRTDHAVHYIDLMASVSALSNVRLLILLAGTASIWDHLPQSGNLAAEAMACRVTLVDPPDASDVSGGRPGVGTVGLTPGRPLRQPSVDGSNDESGFETPEASEALFPKLLMADVGQMVALVPTPGTSSVVVQLPPARRGRLVLATCAGMFVATTGLAVALLPDGPLRPLGLPAAVTLTEVRHLLDRVVSVPPRLTQPRTVARRDTAPAVTKDDGLGTGASVSAPDGAAVAAVEPPASANPMAAPGSPPDADTLTSAAASPDRVADPAVQATSAGIGAALPAVASAAVADPPLGQVVPVVVAPANRLTVAAVSPDGDVAPGLIAMLIARGDALLATGDVNAARLMYRRAASADSAEGAVAMGMTFDAAMLVQLGVLGPQADPHQAANWYRRAAALGSADGRRLLQSLQNIEAK